VLGILLVGPGAGVLAAAGCYTDACEYVDMCTPDALIACNRRTCHVNDQHEI